MFNDRLDAGIQLSHALEKYKGAKNTIILAIPRGGVVLGHIMAKRLELPLELALIKKIGHPSNPEYGIGSVGLTQRTINKGINVSPEYIELQTKKIRALLEKRYQLFYGDKKPASYKGKTVIIVDDGIATGSTIFSAIDLVRKSHAKKIVIALPVGHPEKIQEIKKRADEIVCLEMPTYFYAVGQFYKNFEQVDDIEVLRLLKDLEHSNNKELVK